MPCDLFYCPPDGSSDLLVVINYIYRLHPLGTLPQKHVTRANCVCVGDTSNQSPTQHYTTLSLPNENIYMCIYLYIYNTRQGGL